VSTRSKAAGAVLALLLLLVGYLAQSPGDSSTPAPAASARQGGASTGSGTSAGLPVVDLDRLPDAARRTVALIDRGGPFPYAKDGVTFGNRERLLPVQRSGYYREYTVPTPGSADRGARRIIAGDGARQLFYSDDHYASFARIRR
jgi:ribonuclease T1